MKVQSKVKISLSHFRFIKKATMNDFQYISEWLTDAYNNGIKGYSLYHNLNNHILNAFINHNVFIIRHNGKAIGFLTFSPPEKEDITIIFRIVCIKPDFCRMGIATYLHEKAIEHFMSKGCMVAELYDVCEESFKLGTSMGFKEKIEYNSKDQTSMVKILTNHRKQNHIAKIRFVVWNSYDTAKPPILSWSLNYHKNKKPIIHYVWYDWMVGVVKDGKIIRTDKAKYFFNVLPRGENYIFIDENIAKSILSSINHSMMS